MPKLLQINIVSNYLSTGTIVEDISKVAKARGWDTYVCFGRKSIPGVNKEYRIGSKLESLWHYIENRILDNEGLASKLATYRLIKHIKQIKPDIVHLHNIHDHYLNYQILFSFLCKSNLQVVWTFHDFWAITGHCHHFIDAKCELWKTECHNCPLQHSTVNSLVDRSRRNYYLKKQVFTACNSLTIVPVSYWVGEMIQQSFLKEKRIEVIPNGIDIESFQPKNNYEFNFPNDKFIILAVARDWAYGDRKGLNEFLKLSKRLKNDEVIVLVGMSPSMIEKMPENIIGLERINDKEKLISLYTRANVLLSLSGAETFGLTVIEANACGTPAIVYDNTAPPSLITNKTGFVARDKDIDDVYEKIQIIKSNGKPYYSDECIDHVRRYYDKDKNFNKYVDLYEKLIKQK